MSKQDAQLAEESLQEAEAGNLSDEHHLSTVAPAGGLGRPMQTVPLGGMTELPTSMIALPYVIIVQASTDVYLADNKTPAPKGKFYRTDTQEVFDTLEFVNLRAMVNQREVERDGIMKTEQKLRSLSVNLDEFEPFIFSLPRSSFNSWGKMIAQLLVKAKAGEIKHSYEYAVRSTISLTNNQKGNKFYIANFTLGSKLAEEELQEMKEKLMQYGAVLDRTDDIDE